MSVKRLACAKDSGGTDKYNCSNKRALFVACDDQALTSSALRSRDASMQVDNWDLYEEESPLTKENMEACERVIHF